MFHRIWLFLPALPSAMAGAIIALASLWQNRFSKWEETHRKTVLIIGGIVATIFLAASYADYQRIEKEVTKDDLIPLATRTELHDEMAKAGFAKESSLKKIPTKNDIEEIVSVDKKIVIRSEDIRFFINNKPISEPIGIDFSTSTQLTVNIHNYSGRTLRSPEIRFLITNCVATSPDRSWKSDVPLENSSSLTLSTPPDYRINSIQHGDAGIDLPPVAIVCAEPTRSYYDGKLAVSADDVSQIVYGFKITRNATGF